MTNFEWLISERKEFLKELLKKQEYLAVTKDGELALCHDIECRECVFKDNCVNRTEDWLNAERNPYSIPLDTPIDTRVLVRESENCEWSKRYFAGFENDGPHPYMYRCFDGGNTSWSSDGGYEVWTYCKLAEE